MGKLTLLGYAALDSRVEQFGKDAVVADIVGRIANGDMPTEIAQSYGVPYVCLKAFVEDNAADLMGLARRAHADELVAKALRGVNEAQIEDVSLARLKAETFLKVAGKMDKSGWGDGNHAGGGGMGGVTIVIGRVDAPSHGVAKVVDNTTSEVIEI